MAPDGQAFNTDELSGLNVFDTDGSKIGHVAQVYVDDVSGQPEWITVKTGLFGAKESFIPLAGARRQGTDLHVPYHRDVVKEAPRLEADQHLEPSEEGELYRHYGLTRPATPPTGPGTDTADVHGRPPAEAATGGAPMAGEPASAPAEERATAGEQGAAAGLTEQSLTRSEEQVHVGTEEYETGHARLHKYVVTENVTTTVPVSHEEVHVVREPVAESDRSGGAARIHEQDIEITLHAERPTVRKETVAVERVRLDTEKVTEQQEVNTEVRKEQVEMEDKGEEEWGRGGTG
ncbi:DUF2382 domain-containing protein [Streptomyces sp. NPDC059740]|uniref:DUF2382 domain-containing protein n=1 Tax=Streptomyces sp. NPDC059740 TaxID=3346926 RepID=UPI00364E94AF